MDGHDCSLPISYFFFFLSYLTASVSSVELKNAIQGDADIDRFDAPKSCKKAKLV